MRKLQSELSSLVHLPGVSLDYARDKKAHLEGGRGKNTSGVSSGSPEVDSVPNAFTLVEILVVIAITAIVGTIMVAIFSNTLRGSNKSQILASIKQNGQAVLENMDKTIRNSGDVVCPQIISPLTSASSDTLVVEKNGFYTRFKFTPPTSTSNGMIQQDNPVQPTSGPESDIKVFLDNVCNVYTYSSATILTDTNSQSGVSAKNGLFTRNIQAGSKDSVTVSFTLGPGVGISAAISGQIDPVTFQTTVQLR